MEIPFLGKGKKKNSAPSPSSMRRPAAERVRSLSAQGVSEPEIIRAMRNEGYTPIEVDSAMKQALRTAVDNERSQPPSAPQQDYGSPGGIPELDQPLPPPTEADMRRIFPEETAAGRGQWLSPPFPEEDMKRMQRRDPLELPELPMDDLDRPEKPMPDEFPEDELSIPGIGEDLPPLEGPPPRRASREAARSDRSRQLEEMAEAIVEEKADIFRREVDEVSDEMKKLEAKINVIEERFDRMHKRKRTELDEIKTSILSYKEAITDVSSRMESIERAMKDSMAPMMQTLRSLSDAVKELKSR